MHRRFAVRSQMLCARVQRFPACSCLIVVLTSPGHAMPHDARNVWSTPVTECQRVVLHFVLCSFCLFPIPLSFTSSLLARTWYQFPEFPDGNISPPLRCPRSLLSSCRRHHSYQPHGTRCGHKPPLSPQTGSIAQPASQPQPGSQPAPN